MFANLTPFDLQFYTWLHQISSPATTTFFKFITNFGDVIFIGILLIILLLALKNKKAVLFMMGDYFLAAIVNQVLKYLIKRPRLPEVFWLIPESGYSFPSFHAMGSAAVYSFIIYLIWTAPAAKIKHWLKIIVTAVLSVLTFLIGLSRIYLGVHYLSDVLAGYLFGLIISLFCIWLYKNRSFNNWLNKFPPYVWLLKILPHQK